MIESPGIVKVAIFEPYPFDQIGGNLRTQLQILEHVDRTRYHVTVIVPFESAFTGQARQLGADVALVDPGPRLRRYGGQVLKDGIVGRIRTAAAVFRYSMTLKRELARRSIALLQCNGIRGLLMAGLSARAAGIPLIWYVEGELQNGILDRAGYFLAQRILFMAAANINDRYARLSTLFRRKTGVFATGIDVEQIAAIDRLDRSSVRRELNVSADDVNIVVLGQLYRPKGVHLAIEALARVVERVPRTKLYIVGDHVLEEYSSYKGELDALIAQRRLQDHVVFTGWRSDALDIVSVMDILVHPSLSEGFGRAVLEAMALGKPVVASAVGGLRELIDDSANSFLVAAGDVDALADRLTRLAADGSLRATLGSRARATVAARYSVETAVRGLEGIWAEMVGSHSRSLGGEVASAGGSWR